MATKIDHFLRVPGYLYSHNTHLKLCKPKLSICAICTIWLSVLLQGKSQVMPTNQVHLQSQPNPANPMLVVQSLSANYARNTISFDQITVNNIL